jgi:hypothetical protein
MLLLPTPEDRNFPLLLIDFEYFTCFMTIEWKIVSYSFSFLSTNIRRYVVEFLLQKFIKLYISKMGILL